MNSYPKTVTISSQGQITLPVRLCRKYGLTRGDLVLVDVVAGDLVLQPVRITAVRFEASAQRFSLRCTSRAGTTELGVLAHLTPRRIAQLTKEPTLLTRASQHPDTWVPTVGGGDGD